VEAAREAWESVRAAVTRRAADTVAGVSP